MPFPYIFPFKFDDFVNRYITIVNIEDMLAFTELDKSITCTNILDSLTFMDKRGITINNIADTVKFVEVTK